MRPTGGARAASVREPTMHHDTFADTVAGAAHGGCAEPGGIVDLTDTAGSAACRRCGQPARWWHLDRVDAAGCQSALKVDPL